MIFVYDFVRAPVGFSDWHESLLVRYFSAQLADLKRMPDAASVPAGTSGGPSQLVASIPTQYEAGGSTSQQAAALYPTGHPNLRDPQTSETSLQLGWAPGKTFQLFLVFWFISCPINSYES